MRVTHRLYDKLEALVEKGRRLGEEVGGFIIVPEGGTGVASGIVECENVAPQSERYGSYSFAVEALEEIVDPALDRGDWPVLFHTHGEFSSELSAEDESLLPEWSKVVHGAQGFRVYIWSASSSRYEPDELVVTDEEQ
jgi:hypothetical protein